MSQEAAPQQGQGMSTGVKVFIGCLVVFVVFAIVCGGITAYLAKKGVELATEWKEDFENIAAAPGSRSGDLLEEARKSAPWKEPDDGAIPADRVKVYLEVRRDVMPAYEENRRLFETIDKQKQPGEVGLSDLGQMFKSWAKLKIKYAETLASRKMSSEEYRFITAQVYDGWYPEVLAKEGKLGGYKAPGISPSTTLPEATKAALAEQRADIEKLASTSFDHVILIADPNQVKGAEGGGGRSHHDWHD